MSYDDDRCLIPSVRFWRASSIEQVAPRGFMQVLLALRLDLVMYNRLSSMLPFHEKQHLKSLVMWFYPKKKFFK